MRNATHSSPHSHSNGSPATRVHGRLRLAFFGAALVVAAVGLYSPQSGAQTNAAVAGSDAVCATPGNWMNGTTGHAVDPKELFRDLADKGSVVLLGESHTSPEHHFWQMQTVAGLRARTDNLVIGFESFPRRLQPVLDDWSAGKLTADQFLKAVEWRTVWGYDAALYMPLFQFARLNRIPMIALNIDRGLVSRVGREGWAAVPADARDGLTDPAPASPGYLRELAGVQLMKMTMRPGATAPSGPPQEPSEEAVTEVLKDPSFKRFVEAQQTWDRAFGESLANAKRKYPNATIVAVLGSGHVMHGYGAAHQLNDLGVSNITSLIPVTADNACKQIEPAAATPYADVMFTLPKGSEDEPAVDRPRLGVLLSQGDGAPKITQVVGKSVAETTGLLAGDHVIRAAGVDMRNVEELVDTVGVQAPGTWLPLTIRRDGQEIEFVAKFPPRPRQN
jgi:uncharacterized iron-regulated protein